jgi:hypothetical protein
MHIFLHFIIPAIVAGLFFREVWKKAFLIMTLTIIVDLDHVLATPIYDPGRCSIGLHPLHQFFPVTLYILACFIPKLRFVGIGLVIHMILDSFDCQLTSGVWFV